MTIAPAKPSVAVVLPPNTGAFDRAAGHPYQPYRTALLEPDEVRGFSTLRPWRAILDTLRCWSLILGAWTAVAFWPHLGVILFAMVIVGTQYYGLYILGHDGMHRRLFARRSTNDLFNDLLMLGPIGAITRINNRNHLGHHRHLSTEHDPDRHRHVTDNKDTRPKYLAFLSGLASVYPAVKNVFIGGDGQAEAPRRGRNYSQRDLVILAGWQAMLIGGLTWAIGWWAFPVLWLIPCYLFTYLADLIRSFAEHSHPEPDDLADTHRLITFDSNPIERVFLAPLNMNYHAVHHLWPSIPYYNLPAADRLIRSRPHSVVVPLAAFTAYDTMRAKLGARTSAMLMIVRKP